MAYVLLDCCWNSQCCQAPPLHGQRSTRARGPPEWQPETIHPHLADQMVPLANSATARRYQLQDDLRESDFTADSVNSKWLAEITEHPTDEG
jgi:hypothetical protein